MGYFEEDILTPTVSGTQRKESSFVREASTSQFGGDYRIGTSKVGNIYGGRGAAFSAVAENKLRWKSTTPVPDTAITRQPSIGTLLLLQDEPFLLGDFEGKKIITHNQWSLIGIGETVEEAIEALIEEAEDVAEFYITQSDDSLTVEAIALKRFLERLTA
jgi:hypothetical protein